jgi:hypothetical protein
MTVVEFTIPHVPPSMNRNDVRSSWRGFHNEKRAWQGRFVKALDELDLPRPLPTDSGPLRVCVTLTFGLGRNRDSENYRPVLGKALGDALSCDEMNIDGARYVCGWLLDDTDRDWRLALSINLGAGQDQTHVSLAWGE